MISTDAVAPAVDVKGEAGDRAATGNIFLVGMMGAGKTTVGRLLSHFLEKTFYDSDREIQKRTGVSIPTIFEIEGEEGFRRRETEILSELMNARNIILATGGGAVLSGVNRAMLKHGGTVIYLRASIDDLWRRTRHDKNRPLLQTSDPRARLAELFVQRDPLYRETAHIVVESGKRSPRHLAQSLAQQLTISSRTG
ncbi:shikimate kinase [Nitrosospira multiformis]|uniref:Shikimate kinase n=2 Tax=Nitrosospira multiformis (strain ATCC 25196 / NCIMB 11849 / C 71) TaxID=323848 RepID=AROK_NITMU|nr:shikimate kinase [Nitrosospira multiformis]Q2YBB2.1 RecName: Full=Shikimate kinase; Short=SK [Nitrosospira multiformis ATCC 25196]ABB73959.1 shikimate kinase [Nitrosospira multiformis ATCC 25196]SEA31180.1 shikimate kinase [Nitrosospira multiformis]SEF53294.1 shikimate kinase [Nitrosospira multiformis ATCC 25196]